MAVQTEAILAVSFGTSHNDTRERTIDRIEAKLQESYPDRRIYRAWTSDMIRKKLEKRHFGNGTRWNLFLLLNDFLRTLC